MDPILERSAVRVFTDQAVEDDKIQALLHAALQAPSAGNQQPWEFYVVTNPELIEELSTVSPYSGCAKNASVLIVPVYHTDCRMPEYAQIDLSIACENIWLEAVEQGLGTVLLGIAPLEDRMERVKALLNLPENEEAFGIMPVGYPKAHHKIIDRFDEDRIHYIK